MTEPTKKEHTTPEAVKQKSTFLTAEILWYGNAWNATPEDAAQQVVADLFKHLSLGGKVSVHIEGSDGMEHALQVTARRE